MPFERGIAIGGLNKCISIGSASLFTEKKEKVKKRISQNKDMVLCIWLKLSIAENFCLFVIDKQKNMLYKLY